MKRWLGDKVKEGVPRGRLCPQCGESVLEKEVDLPSVGDDGRYLDLVCSECDWHKRQKI